VVALVEQGISVLGISPTDIVLFSRTEDMAIAIQKVTAHIQALHLQQPTSSLVTGLVVGGLILLLLRALGGRGDQG